MDDLFDVSYEDAQQLKKDDFVHSFTAYDNLKKYGRALRAAGNTVATAEIEAAQAWLNENSTEIDGELYTSKGQPRFSKSEWPESALGDDGMPEYSTEDDPELGLYFVGAETAYKKLHDMAEEYDNPASEIYQAYRTYGLGHQARGLLEEVRAARLVARLEEQQRRARWRGMEEWDAVAKADDKLREGAGLSAGASTAVQLPSVERLRELFSVEDGELVWAVSRGRIAKGSIASNDVKIDGRQYKSKRVVYKMVTGDDPQSAAVSDDLSLNKYRVRGGCTAEVPRVNFDNQFDALVRIGGELIKVGVYKTEAQAKAAADIYIRSMERGLL